MHRAFFDGGHTPVDAPRLEALVLVHPQFVQPLLMHWSMVGPSSTSNMGSSVVDADRLRSRDLDRLLLPRDDRREDGATTAATPVPLVPA